MKNYFKNECDVKKDDIDILTILKKKYDESDDIFEKRFENLTEEKIKKPDKLKQLIEEVKKYNEKECSKMIALTLGNAYLRLAQCQNEVFEKYRENNQKAINYLEEYIDYSNTDEIDLLLMLNKGKYYRNTAEVGKKSDYDRALAIFSDVAKSVENVNISKEKKFHLLLDAKINIGRVSRYKYDFKQAKKIFLSMIRVLEGYVNDNIKIQLYECSNLANDLRTVVPDMTIKKYVQDIEAEEVSAYTFEYLLQSLIHIGIIARKEKSYKKAIEIFELINKIDQEGAEENIDARNNLGVCYRKLGDKVGRTSEDGRKKYKQAEEIFIELDHKGNKFASVNLFKCKLNREENHIREVIEQLEQLCNEKSNSHLQFTLGRFYKRICDYSNAMKCFEQVYHQKNYIARGSLGFKAYYNLAECKICVKKFSEARDILMEIRKMLKKNQDDPDVSTEIDYGWCLMNEENYRKALDVYQILLDFYDNKDKKKGKKLEKNQRLKIYNNIADCYIHLEMWEEAQNYIQKALDIEKDDEKALYLKGVILLNSLVKKENFNYSEVYNLFDNLMKKKTVEMGTGSAWLISAILLYEYSNDEKIKNNIIKRIKYSADSISMRSFFCLANFILHQIQLDENNEKRDLTRSTLYRDFCHIKLIEHDENKTFQRLMDSMDFHYFETNSRAFLLAHIVQMYKYILNIKHSCWFTYGESGDVADLPYHYTKLSTLNYLLIKQGTEEPRLRLWNSAYMNDAYEGGVFTELLVRAALSENVYKRDQIMQVLEKYIANSTDSKVQIDSNVYITSFSAAKGSFQMWSIYGDSERGVAIKFEEDFFDIKNRYPDLILDSETDEYALYKVKYLDGNALQDGGEISADLKKIWFHLEQIECKMNELKKDMDSYDFNLFRSAETEIRTFIADRLNEVRFLYKTKSYEYEDELRLIRCSHNPEIDDKNFAIPRLYIDVEKTIKNIDVKIGNKLENEQIKNLYIWLKNTGKVKNIEVSCLDEK